MLKNSDRLHIFFFFGKTNSRVPIFSDSARLALEDEITSGRC